MQGNGSRIEGPLCHQTDVPTEYYELIAVHGNLELTSSSGTIASPMYPNQYFGVDPVEWRILIQNLKQIQLNFRVFDLERFFADCEHSGTLQVRLFYAKISSAFLNDIFQRYQGGSGVLRLLEYEGIAALFK